MFNQYIIYAAIAAILASFIGGGLLGWHEKSIRVPALLMAQGDADKKVCDQAQLITKGANDALQKNRDAIARKLSALKLQHASTCVPVTRPSLIPISGNQSAGSNGEGLGTDWLRDYAAEAEGYRSSLVVCTDFLHQERIAVAQ